MRRPLVGGFARITGTKSSATQPASKALNAIPMRPAAGVVGGAGAVLLAVLEQVALEVAGAEVIEGGDVGSGGSSRQEPSCAFILNKNKDGLRQRG